MKNSMIRLVFFSIAISILFQSCLKDDCSLKRTYFRYDPVYVTLSELRSGLKLQDAQELKSPGKIYVYGDYLLVNEIKQGIHVYDNSNPANPVKINFIEIPGNVDMAVRDGILYADNYVDLLAIDIKDPQHPNLICRTENVFSPISIDPLRGMLVDYTRREETLTLDCNSDNFNVFRFFEGDIMFDASGPSTNLPGSKNGNFTGVSGIGGSMARFTITSNYLYTVDMSHLYSFFVDATCPVLKNKVQIGWNIETIFPYDDKLFIGSTSGMFIYVLNNPAIPAFAGSMNHLRSCDPVIVQGDYAYVTLHGGSACGGFTNQLDVVDVKNIFNPRLVKSHTLEYPLGLGIKDDYLFICDKALKVFKLESQIEIKLETMIPQHNPYDVIVLPDRDNLILISESGIHQYDISKCPQLSQLSFIPVN